MMIPARALIDATMTEAQFQRQVISLANLCGWMVYHTYDSRRCQAGYPDLTLVHPRQGRLLFVEVKSEKGRLRPEQVAWIDAINRSGVTCCYVWRPSMWDEVVETLSPQRS